MTDQEPVTQETAKTRAAARASGLTLKKAIAFVSAPKIFYYLLFYLTAILVVGTITQQELGIYGAQERYFSAWITYCMDSVPVPGGRLILLVMSANLMCKLLFNSRWYLKGLGVHIAHIGTMLLMIGSLLTAYFSVEGSLYIPEGGSSRYYVDNEQIAISVTDTSGIELNWVVAFSGPYLRESALLRHAQFPGTIKILEFHRNASLELSAEKSEADWRGFARRHVIRPQRLAKESNANRPAAVIEVTGFDEASNGRYIVAQVEGPTSTISAQGKVYELAIGPRVYPLPNNLRFELIDFVAEYHPGTGKPSHFSSKLRIYENNTQREALIQMNEPLRMHDHTFYQSSFVQEDGREATILSVVKNYGRMFPYISSIVICIGIGLHLLLHYPAFLAGLTRRD